MTWPNGDAVMVFLNDADGRTLLVRPQGLLRDYWMPPGGHIDPGETPAAAACREVAEEVHIRCAPEDLHQLLRCDKDRGNGTLTLFETTIDPQPQIAPGPEIAEARWIDLDACTSLPMLPATNKGLRLVRQRATAREP